MTSCTDATGLRRHLWRAVLRPERLEREVQREVVIPEGPLARWVEQVWSLAWSVPVPPSSSALITHPAVHLTVEHGPLGEVRHGHRMPAALLHGVPTRPFRPDLPAHGWVVGLHLVPGSVLDLTGRPASTWTDRVVPWPEALPGWDLDAVFSATGPVARARTLHGVAEAALKSREPSDEGLLARRVEALVRTDRTVRSVEDLAARTGLGLRSLQRLCRDHVGVSPRWLLRRARVLDAHELLSTTDRSVAQVAHDLGWYDQAHLTRDYTAVTGVPPARHRRLVETDRAPDPGAEGAGRAAGEEGTTRG